MNIYAAILVNLALALGVFAFVFLLVLLLKFSRKRLQSRYEAIPLLTPAERNFYRRLVQIFDGSVIICFKVRLADVISPNKTLARKEWVVAFNRISKKHLDFVCLRSNDLSTLGVIELDDSSHARNERYSRDVLVDSCLTESAIPICRIKAKKHYDLPDLSRQITHAFRLKQNTATD